MIGNRVKDFWKNKCGPVGKVVTSSALGIILLGVLNNAIFNFVPWLSIPKFIANLFLLFWNSGIRDVLLFLVLLMILILRTRRKKSTRGAGVSRNDFATTLDEKSFYILGILLTRADKMVSRPALIKAYNSKFGTTTNIDYNLIESDLIKKDMIEIGPYYADIPNVGITPKGCEHIKKISDAIDIDEKKIKAQPKQSKQKERKSAPPPASPVKQP